MKWFEQKEVLSYIVDCYAGAEPDRSQRAVKRQFIWEEPNGDLVIGNTRAFGDHLTAKFGLHSTPTAWMGVHEALRAMGEVLFERAPNAHHPGKKFKNQQPEIRIIKRKS